MRHKEWILILFLLLILLFEVLAVPLTPFSCSPKPPPDCSLQTHFISEVSIPPDQNSSIDFTGVSLFPEQTFYLNFHNASTFFDLPWLVAPLRILMTESLNYSTGEIEYFMIGFEVKALMVQQPLLTKEFLGIGFHQIRTFEYSYITSENYNHSSSIGNYDTWTGYNLETNESWGHLVSYHELPCWTANSAYIGDAASVAVPEFFDAPLRLGYYLTFSGLSLYFADGIIINCTPQDFILWAEFQWDGSQWATNSSIWRCSWSQEVLNDPDGKGRPKIEEFLGTAEADFYLSQPLPNDPRFIERFLVKSMPTIIGGAFIAVGVVIICVIRDPRIRNRISRRTTD